MSVPRLVPAMARPTALLRQLSSVTRSTSPVVWTYLPTHLPYPLGLLLQETLVSHRLRAKKLLASPSASYLSPREIDLTRRTAETDILLLLQHTPVYTAGRREKDLEATTLEGERLRAMGADYVVTMRGGQTTYHGPGQLVGYPLMDLGTAQLTTRCYVHHLEKFLATLTTSLGVPVHPLEHTGVFTSPTSKIGSIGIHVRHRMTLHGFSLNIEEQTLPWFQNIVACGLDEVSATSVESELRTLGKDREGTTVVDAVDLAVQEFGKEYGRDMVELATTEEYADLAEVIANGATGKLPPLRAG